MKCKVCGRPLGTTDTDFEEIYGIHAGPCEHREPMTGAEYQQLVAFYTKHKGVQCGTPPPVPVLSNK